MSADLKTPAGRKGRSTREPSTPEGIEVGTPEGIVDQPSSQATDTAAHTAALKVPAAEHVGRRLARMVYRAVQIALAVGLGYWIATTRATQDTRIELPPAKVASNINAAAVAVTVEPVMRRQIERAIDAVGSLHGYDELTLKTKISGRVAKIHHDFADRVEPGALLVEIDPTDSQLAVEQAKRSLNSELAKWGFVDVPQPNADLTQLPTVVSAKVRMDLAKSQFSRLSTLQNRGSVTAEELEQAKTNALVAESDYANQLLLARAGAANAQLKKSELDIAEQQLRETKVYVPMRDAIDSLKSAHYTITDRYVTEGAWLAAGTDLFRLVIDDPLKLRLSIPEKHAASVQIGQRVEVSTLMAGRPVIGRLARIGPSVDPQTRTFQIEAEVPNEDSSLKTGGFAKARVITNDESSAVTVPTAALVTFAGVHKVFVLRDERAVEYRVKLGEQTAEWVEIVDSELPADAQVIVSGQSLLADGSPVRLRALENSSVTEKAEKNAAEKNAAVKNADEKTIAGSGAAQ